MPSAHLAFCKHLPTLLYSLSTLIYLPCFESNDLVYVNINKFKHGNKVDWVAKEAIMGMKSLYCSQNIS